MHHTDTDTSSSSGHTLANLAIGALAGAAAVWVMDRVDNFNFRHEDAAARLRTQAVRPDGQPPAQVMVKQVAELTGHSLSRERINRIGQGAHYMIGVGPAMLYAALGSKFPAITRGRGAAFGLGMFLLQDELMNPLMGWSAKPGAYPWQAHARGLVGHLVYGMTADAVVRTLQKRMQRGDADSTRMPTTTYADNDASIVRSGNDAVVAPLHAAPPQSSTGAGSSIGMQAG
ncbi:DUF1440 domain-containing protein [Cognatilysobacter bugurensis]|uniref:DUF1440 domain-containing protein n=1 Tax=Cognatilysobacter bugurensis TaxID=543356 RepID=A0A918T6Y1_9GAMM|nr:DUF1440 domain-containing protein [Lysobacter bugurensis]GHA87620.1 hypothetical protein GCM10007067_27020 [Lysobacter bugurensis]